MHICGISHKKTLSESSESMNNSIAMLITSKKDTDIVTNATSTNDQKISATAEVLRLLDIFSDLKSIPHANKTTTDLIAKFSAFMKTQMVYVPSVHKGDAAVALKDANGNSISLYDYAVAGPDAVFHADMSWVDNTPDNKNHYQATGYCQNPDKIAQDMTNVDWREWWGKVSDTPTETDPSGGSWHLRHTAAQFCHTDDKNEFTATGGKNVWRTSLTCVATNDAQGKATDIQTFLAENMPH
jgi:hypothetical protein